MFYKQNYKYIQTKFLICLERKLKVFISNPPPKGEKGNDFTPKPARDSSHHSFNTIDDGKMDKRFGRAMRLEMIPRSLSKNTAAGTPKAAANN